MSQLDTLPAQQKNAKYDRWWRTVHIGSLKFSPWSVVHETVTLRQVQAIFQTTTSAYLIVIQSLDPLNIIGVIFPSTVESAVASALKEEKTERFHTPVSEMEGMISKNYKLLPMSGGVIGNMEDALEGGTDSVILYRSTHILSAVQSNNNNDAAAVERKHLVAVLTQTDVKRWIAEVEQHHNIT